MLVFIPELQRSTFSNDKGAFSLENLPKSTVRIQFLLYGYKSVVRTVNPEVATSVDIQMEPSVTELEEVLVTTNNTSLSDNTPFSANSISQGEIRKFGSPSVMGNLSYQPGIDRISIGNGIGKPVIRGLSFNRLLLYGQGTRIDNQQWDDHHDLGLSDIGVQNVEIVRGPAALIYGADALGGALIFVDEKPAAMSTSSGDVNLGFGSNTLGINADAGLKSTSTNGFFYGFRIGGQSHTSYLQGESDTDKVNANGEKELFAANSKFSSTVAKANMGFSKKWGVTKLSYSFLNQQIGIIENEAADTTKKGNDEAEQRDRDIEAPYQDVTTQIISWENTLFTGKSKLNMNVAYQMNKREEFEPLPNKQKELAIGLDLGVATYDVKWTSDADKEFGVTLGSQGTFLKNRNTGKESLVPNADVSDVAGYGLFRYDKDKLNLLGGIRYDMRKIEADKYEPGGPEEDTLIQLSSKDTVPVPETDFEKEYSPLSFSFGAAYHINENLTFKLNAASGFTAPNYAQLATFGRHEGTYRFERGDSNLKMEQNREGDIGMIWENEFVSLDIAAYINKVQNYIYIINTGDTMVRITPDGKDTLPIYDYRQGNATLAGGEFGFDIHPKSAKWLDVKATYALIRGTLDAGGNLPYIPSNKLVGEIKLTKEKIWKLNEAFLSCVVSNYSKQNNVTQYELSSEGHTLLDVHIGAEVRLFKQQASFNIFCTNLLNTAYFNQLSLVKYIGIRDMGRNIGVQLHIPFGWVHKG